MSTAAYNNDPSTWNSDGTVGNGQTGVASMLLNNPMMVNDRQQQIANFQAMLGLANAGGQTGQTGNVPFKAWINQPSATQGAMPNYSLLAQDNYAQGQKTIPTQNIKPYYKA